MGFSIEGADLKPLLDPGMRRVIAEAMATIKAQSPADAAVDHAAWELLRMAFDYPSEFINLENGYYCSSPKIVLENYLSDARRINQDSSRYMRQDKDAAKELVRTKLAALAGVDPEELAFTRNTTESMDVLISGMDLRAGDEVILSQYDYGAMVAAFEQQAERFGVIVKRVDFPILPESQEALIAPYRDAISARTRLILVTHMIHYCGLVMPAKAITDLGRSHGIPVIVDAAHSFAQMDFKIPELGADYFGTSLHKWLSAPLGNGLLKVSKDKIADLWPLFGNRNPSKENIRKFEQHGNGNPANWLGIGHALDFHNAIGGAQKAARLQFLKQYWTSQVQDLPQVQLMTSADTQFSWAIANVGLRGKSPFELADYLFKAHKVYTVGISIGEVQGVRVTPHLHTTTADLDRLVQAIIQAGKAI